MPVQRERLRAALSSPAGKRRYVRRLFDTIANRYDLITVALSYGLDRRWKRRLVRMADIRAGERALDLACGTGDLLFEAQQRGASVIGLDITFQMIRLARRKQTSQPRRSWFLVGDMVQLPFPSRSFELITTGYGLRSVPDLEEALAEIFRVLKPGGRMLSLDFNRPAHRLTWLLYYAYLTCVGSILGALLHGDPDTYRYIPESIRTYVGAEGVSRRMRECGFDQVSITPLLGGLMAINYGSKPAEWH